MAVPSSVRVIVVDPGQHVVPARIRARGRVRLKPFRGSVVPFAVCNGRLTLARGQIDREEATR